MNNLEEKEWLVKNFEEINKERTVEAEKLKDWKEREK